MTAATSTCTNEGRLNGALAGFNVYSKPPWPCLTINRQQKKYSPQESRGVPVLRVVRTEIGEEAGLIFNRQIQRQAREEKQIGKHKQKTKTKTKTKFFSDFTAFGAGPACCRKPSAHKMRTRKKTNCYIGTKYTLFCAGNVHED